MAVNHDDQTLFLVRPHRASSVVVCRPGGPLRACADPASALRTRQLFTYVEYDLQDILSWHYGSGFGQPPAPLPEFTLRSLAWQLLSGLSYLHRRFVIHRDVKPSNVLVTGEAHPSGLQGCVKIADFGLARLVNEPLRPLFENGLVVTIWYRAPELLLGAKHYTRAVDMWAVRACCSRPQAPCVRLCGLGRFSLKLPRYRARAGRLCAGRDDRPEGALQGPPPLGAPAEVSPAGALTACARSASGSRGQIAQRRGAAGPAHDDRRLPGPADAGELENAPAHAVLVRARVLVSHDRLT